MKLNENFIILSSEEQFTLTRGKNVYSFVNLNTPCKNCESNFIWGKMRTITWETAPQIALRNCSKGATGKAHMYVILVNGAGVIAIEHFFFFSRMFLLVTRSSHQHEKF